MACSIKNPFFLITLAVLVPCLLGCGAGSTETAVKFHEETVQRNEQFLIDSAINGYLFSLPPEQRISQIFLVNIEGNIKYRPSEYSDEIDSYAGSSHVPLVPGGAILFAYNIADSAEDMIGYMASVADYCESNNIARPYIAIDQEGGYVARLRKMTSPLPSNEDVASRLTPNEAYELYSLQAKQMRALGIDMNLAPVCESLNEGNRDFLINRSFGDIVKSTGYSLVAVEAYQDNGVGTVLKHFPGNSNTDPHSGLPEINLTKEELYYQTIIPFSFILSASPTAVLMSHARTKTFDSENPASLSHTWVTGKLKKELDFGGLILSDDIFMGALSKNGFPPDIAAVKAIEAGIHVIMLSEKRFGSVARTLLSYAETNPDFEKKLVEAEKKVLEFKLRTGILKMEKDSDDGYKIVQSTDNDQNGSKENRLKIFHETKRSGELFYTQIYKQRKN